MQTRSRSSKSPPTSGDDVNPAEDVNPNLKSRASPKAFWLPEDEAALIAFLLTKAVGNTADNHTFKDHVYIEAAKLINPLCQKGSEKTSGSCKSKYAKLKRIYDTVRRMKEPPGISGLTWDDEKGMNITKDLLPGTRAVWAEYIRHNKLAVEFATHGWAHYESMNILLSTSKDKGDRSHQPLLEAMRTTPAPTPSSSSTQLNILLSSSASSKRKSKPFDILAESTSSKKNEMKSGG